MVAPYSRSAGLVLYPHFTDRIIPGWLDKALRHRHRATERLANVVVLAPAPDWVATLPNAKLPDRSDFTHYGQDITSRQRVWSGATAAAAQLADEFAMWLERPDLSRIEAL